MIATWYEREQNISNEVAGNSLPRPPRAFGQEWDPYGEQDHRMTIVPFVHWSKEEVEEFETEEMVRRLRAFGIPFDKTAFREDVQRFFSAEDLSKHWTDTYDFQPVERRDPDFPWFACVVLWDRLCSEIPYGEQLDDLMQEGYAYMEDDRRKEACDV